MKISLIVATIGRTVELQRLLESLTRQTHRDFEIIIVDQNGDERLAPVINEFKQRLPIQHLTCQPGVSRARNLGIQRITGGIIAFPDDDCWYPDDLLAKIVAFFDSHTACAGVVVNVVDQAGKRILPWNDHAGPLTPPKCWRQAMMVAIFLRRTALDAVGGFDETLGPGAGTPWGSGEDIDLVFRSMAVGSFFRFEPSIEVLHPRIYRRLDEAAFAKRFAYSATDGWLLRKYPMPVWWKLLFFGIPACRLVWAMLRFNKAEMRFHQVTVSGRYCGWRARRPIHQPNQT